MDVCPNVPPGSGPGRLSGVTLIILLLLLALVVCGMVAYLALRPSATRPAPVPVVLGEPAAVRFAETAGPSRATGPESNLSPPEPLAALRALLAQTPLDSPALPHISTLLAPTQSLTARRQAARALARLGTEEAMAALKVGLSEGGALLRGAIAEALGTSAHPEARELLLTLLEGDEASALGAIRGFGERADAEAADLLANILRSDQKSETARIEAALALGAIAQPEALTALTQAASEIREEAIVSQVLEGLARKPLAETGEFFRSYLENPTVPNEAKVAALEALGQAEGDATSLLLNYASHAETELRAAAALGLATTESQNPLSPQLLALIERETVPEVRARLYQALGNQEDLDPTIVLALARQENDPAARLAVLNLAANECDVSGAPELLQYFNATAVPELTTTALTGARLNDRLTAVLTLHRSGTPEAISAVQQIRNESSDPKVLEAIQAIRERGPSPR